MPKIKEVYEYSNGSWANGTPIGADASNVDVALSDSTSTRDLQTVLGNVSVSDPSMKTQLTGKVNASGGDIKDTVVSVLDPASETDTSEDINGTDVVVAAGESQTTMWSKFNMFRKRVSNKFSNFLISSVEDVVTPSDTKTYSQAALNSYFADVIGYKTDADVATVGSVADQLSTLNNKFITYTVLCYWGAYQNVGSVINLLYPYTDFDLIAIRHGYATNNQSGGGAQYAIVPADGMGESAEDPFGLTGTLNGNIYNITMYWSSPTQLKILYNYSYSRNTSPGGTIRSILGFKLGAANHGNP